MNIKRIIISLIYLIALFLLASPSFIGVFTHGLLLTIFGSIGMLGLTGAYGAYMHASIASDRRSLPELSINEETEYDKFKQTLSWFKTFQQKSTDETTQNKCANPFRNTPLGERIQDAISDLQIKYNQTLKILSESFDQNAITYRRYLSVLDNVLKLSSAHMQSIKKRISVFDYRAWSENKQDKMCRKYIDEIESNVVSLEEINDKFDNLLHELICLNEISEEPLLEMQNLIESTSDYKTIED